jgi:hypothetical protein
MYKRIRGEWPCILWVPEKWSQMPMEDKREDGRNSRMGWGICPRRIGQPSLK